MELKTAQIQKQSVTVSPERKHCVSQRSVDGVPKAEVVFLLSAVPQPERLICVSIAATRARAHAQSLSLSLRNTSVVVHSLS